MLLEVTGWHLEHQHTLNMAAVKAVASTARDHLLLKMAMANKDCVSVSEATKDIADIKEDIRRLSKDLKKRDSLLSAIGM